jgi:hypothetical protein
LEFDSVTTPEPHIISPEAQHVSNVMNDFTDNRIQRAYKLAEIYDLTDPNVMKDILGDIVTLLENVYIALTPMPEDGFVSLTPKDNDGSGE